MSSHTNTSDLKPNGTPHGSAAATVPTSSGRRRTQRSFPAAPFEESLELANAIQRISGGQRVRRLTLFEHLGRSPESGASRQAITNSSRYGVTTGSYHSEWIELTPDGDLATSAETPARRQAEARFRLAIEQIAPFNELYQRFKDHKLPTQAVMRDALRDAGYPDEELQECVETFIVNAKFLELLRTIAGSERLLSIEHALDELPAAPAQRELSATAKPHAPTGEPATTETGDWARICFYVTPIGDDESEERQHADVILAALIEPALEELGLKVVRADQIDKPGMITAQVIEHIAKVGLVIADLSFLNPNVFYELALRHASGKPTVQLIRSSDEIPFDLEQVRTITIDTTSLYAFVPQIEVYKAEIASQARSALEGGGTPSPLSVFYPEFPIAS